MDRRTILKSSLALAALKWPLASWAATEGSGQKFSYAVLKGVARHFSNKTFESHEGELPESLRDISWDDYQAIRFRPEKSFWREDDLAFRAQLFHLGLYFQTPVKIFEVVDGKATEFRYEPDFFDYSGKRPLGKLPGDLGYAGFRVQFHSNFALDLAAFLGASYFRAVGESMQYGLSARGLAIDTGLGRPEEFPLFSQFYLERPNPGSSKLTVYALLDSPSITGAYRFEIYPGRNLVMDIDAALYPRKPIERLGIAPLTSMYQTGENDRRMANDWRREIHDSDGLAIWSGSGERIWRPLVNPRGLRTSLYADKTPKGFGLLQRDREFDHYQDDGVFYERRPSLWVQPKGDWGEGSVMLIEIPTKEETFDNVVAFWNPAQEMEPGKEHLMGYRLHWGAEPPDQPYELATAQATRTGIGGVIGSEKRYFSRRFAIDFAGGILGMLGPDAQVEPVITCSRGRTEIESARPLHEIRGRRLMFDLIPDDSTDPIEIRAYLRLGYQALSETWSYQYSPPPLSERR